MVYMELFHGRNSPGEQLNDWGFSGPVLGPLPFVHITYGCHVLIRDEKLPYHFENTDLMIHGDGLLYLWGSYYGDFSTFSSISKFKEIKKRWLKTNQITQTPKENLPLLINDKEPWVKNYITRIMKEAV